MQKKATILALVAFVLFVGYMIYSSMSLSQVTCEVCIDFRGQTQCRTASGTTREEAKRTATDVACAVLGSNMNESIACGNTRPSKLACTE